MQHGTDTIMIEIVMHFASFINLDTSSPYVVLQTPDSVDSVLRSGTNTDPEWSFGALEKCRSFLTR